MTISLRINDQVVQAEPGTLLIEACRRAGIAIPHYCYHPALTPVATCRMCLVEIKGQPKLVTSCSTPVAEGLEVYTASPAVADARAGIMEFLLLNHPLDCPVCDQAGECRLQDYSYAFGAGDSRMTEPRRRNRYEDLGAKIVLDKNRCIHCTRCVRFTQEISETHELTMASRGASLEVTTYAGKTLDANPLAGNVADLCPVGALTSRDFRFAKRVWYLKSTPSISRHGALASPIWVDHEGNRAYRFRPRPEDGKPHTSFIFDEERYAWHRYDLDPAGRLRTPLLKGQPSAAEAVAEALHTAGPVAVLGQGTFGCDTAQALGRLASQDAWRFGTGDRMIPIRYRKLQSSGDGIFNRRGFAERGYRYGHLEQLLELVSSGAVKAVLILHDPEFSGVREAALIEKILDAAAFSLVFETLPWEPGRRATAVLPAATYLEESDFVINHEGTLRRYQKALEPPRGVLPVTAWARILAKAPGAV